MNSIRQNSQPDHHLPSSKKIKLVIFIIIFIVTILGLIILEKTIVKNVITSQTNKLLPKEYLDFYRQHYKTVNHLKSINEFSTILDYPTPESLIYSKIGSSENKILVQGDSWAEQFVSSETSLKKLEAFAQLQNVEFILAGITSYSPSLMTAQLELLRREFSISAENIVSVIDQTDIGDELCRYKNKRIKGNLGLEVQPFNESDSLEVYNMTNYFRVVDILHSDSFNLVKLILVARNQLAQFFAAQKKVKCPWQEISKPLKFGLDTNDTAYIKSVLAEYIEKVFLDSKVEKLFIVTVPHKKHLDDYYKFDIVELLKFVISESPFKNKIINVRIEDRTLLNYNRGNPFIKGDLASHLTDIAHGQIITQRILNEIGR
jgi:hypothetical protein